MSEWLLSERQSICVCCDRMSAPMPCVLLTQCYGFFILSNQWYMKQHRHISTIHLFFFYFPLHHTNIRCNFWQCTSWDVQNEISSLHFSWLFLWLSGSRQNSRNRWKTSNKYCSTSEPNKWSLTVWWLWNWCALLVQFNDKYCIPLKLQSP